MKTNNLVQRLLIALFALTSSCALAQNKYEAPTALERNVETIVVKADGSYAQTSEVVFRVETPQGIEDAGTLQISYISSQETIESVEAWTTQPDGTRIPVLPESIRTRDEDNSGGAAQFSDTKIKAMIFPQVQVGSRVSYKTQSLIHTPPYLSFDWCAWADHSCHHLYPKPGSIPGFDSPLCRIRNATIF